MKINATFTGTITKTEGFGWTYVQWPESVKTLGTGKAIKVTGTMDGHEFQTAFMAWGDGTHILPVKAALLKAMKKQIGDTIEIHIKETL